jgi:hypothetical protein
MTDENKVDDADTDVFEATGTAGPSKDNDGRWIALPPAGMLGIPEADELLRWRNASIIAIVGERNGGKTTLIAELYERFLRGPFAETLFTHSLSLLGLERKTFQSRAESGAESPDTPRTSKQDGLGFFHLAVSNDQAQRTDLLISERAGETYRDVRDRPAEALDLIEVRKAKTIVFILDGERVADPLRRAEAIASVRHLARAFTDSNAIASHCEVQLVTTKMDLLASDALAGARAALETFEQQFIATHSSRFTSVETFRVAARDPKGIVEAGFGFKPLLQSWLKPALQAAVTAPSLPQLADEFDRLLVRRLG